MKRFAAFAVAFAAFGFANAAGAADMPSKAPIYKATPSAATNWTGFYVNGGLGYGLWAADTTTEVPGTGVCILCFNQEQGGKGWLGAIGAGYDYQFASSFLAGVFADYDLSSLKGTIQDQGPFFAGDIKQTSAWAVGARVGWLFNPKFLAYVNGGYTSARFSGADMVTTFAGAPTGFSTQAFTTSGWFVGGGTETVVAPGWFWRNEYRYARYSNKTLADTDGTGGAAASINFKPTVQTITSGIVYKLNNGGPSYPTPAPFTPMTWSGLYVNGGLGYGLWAADTTTEVPGTGVCILCFNQEQGGKGWLGVIGAGYDYQFASRFLAGIFADVDWSSLKGTVQDQGPFFVGDIKQTSAWAVGARGGWLASPQILSYLTAGYTAARFSGANMVTTFAGAASGFSTPAFTANGWFLGGGGEVAVAPGWFWRTEYRYAHYSDKTLPDTDGTGALAASIHFKPEMQTFTTQMVYKFNWMH